MENPRHFWYPKKSMSPRQISIIKASWRLLMKIDPRVVGGLFYDKLFHDTPAAEKLFSVSREEQAKKLVEMVNVVIMRLDRLEELSEDIRQLAIRHVGYGTQPDHYALVGKALLWTLKRGLGNDWTPELEEAWTQCYTLLANTMIRAAEEHTNEQTP